MKTRTWLSILLPLIIPLSLFSQDLIQYPAPSLKLKIEQEGGRNGAYVAYNPEAEVYYAVIAGNADFPLETFSNTGANIYQSKAYNDMRGIWWNPKTKELEGNCYDDGGIVSIGVDENGNAGIGNRIIFEGSHQPSEQVCGAYDPKKKEILYYDMLNIVGYSRKTGEKSGTNIGLYIPVMPAKINSYSLMYTGKKKMEIALLNYEDKQVYLFNKKTGTVTGTVNLPKDAVVYEYFNIAYANEYLFLFNQETRTWIGYKIF